MTLTRITLAGCDASTKVDVELTEDQRALIEWMATLTVEKSNSSCQPVLRVADAPELCAACKPSGECDDPFGDSDAEGCVNALIEASQRQEGTTTS